MEIVRDIQEEIKTDEVFRLLGSGRGKKVSRRLKERTERIIKSSQNLIRPRVLYKVYGIERVGNGSVKLAGDVSLKSGKLARCLRKCDRVTIFLVTVGKRIDHVVHSLMRQRKTAEASIYDAVGSVAVEEAVERFQESFDRAVAEAEEKTTLRFSPGYCDWQVEEQRNIFRALDNSLIDVELEPSCLMRPRKSVSGVFGIGRIEDIDKTDSNPCMLCSMKHCMARRA